MSSPRRPALLLAALAAGTIGLAGCGGDDAAATTTAPATSTPTGQGCQEPPALPADVPTFDSAPDPATVEGKTLTATLTTTCGDIEIDLYADKAPQTVASFQQLADNDYWVDSPCFRLTTAGIFVLQCGDPTGTGSGTPGYGFGIENAPADGDYPPGTLAMARTSDPNSNGGQFFIVYEETRLPVEGGGYSIFGRVTEGLEIVEAIAAEGVEGGGGAGTPAQPVSIRSVDVG